MQNEVATNEWGVILRHPDALELRWLPTTAAMSDGAFMATLCLLAAEAEKARPRAIFIDATDFKHRFDGPHVMQWRDAHVVPRYGAAGVRKVAFLMPGFPDVGKIATEAPAVFSTKYFDERAAALAWLDAR
jgi:hypothetical protein